MLQEVGLAGLPDEVRHVPHPGMHRELACLLVLHQPEACPDGANEQATVKDRHPRQPAEMHLIQRRNFDVRFAPEESGGAEEVEDEKPNRSNP